MFSNKPCNNLRSNIISYEIYDPFSVHAKRRAKVKTIKIKFMIPFFSFLCLNNLSFLLLQYQFHFCSSFSCSLNCLSSREFYLIAFSFHLNYYRQLFCCVKSFLKYQFSHCRPVSKGTPKNNMKPLVLSLTFIDFLSSEEWQWNVNK